MSVKKNKFHQEIEQEDGWSKPIYPSMKKYLMKCCDCGLVHELKFNVVEVIETKSSGFFDFENKDDKKFRVCFKARRHL